MPKYPYVSLNTIIEFRDQAVYGLNIETRATNPSKIARLQAINLAKSIYEDPMMLINHPKFQAFPFHDLKVIKTSVKIPSGIIEEKPYKAFQRKSASVEDKLISCPKSESHHTLSPGSSWLLKEAEYHGLFAEDDNRNQIRFASIIGAICSQHPAINNQKQVCFFMQIAEERMIEYLRGKTYVKLPVIADTNALQKFKPIIEEAMSLADVAMDYDNRYYLLIQNPDGVFVKEYPKGNRCLGEDEVREKSLEMLRPFIRNLLPTSDGLSIDLDCNFKTFSSDDDIDNLL